MQISLFLSTVTSIGICCEPSDDDDDIGVLTFLSKGEGCCVFTMCRRISMSSKLIMFEHVRFTEKLDIDDEAENGSESPSTLVNLPNLPCINCSKSCNEITFSLREFEEEREGERSSL